MGGGGFSLFSGELGVCVHLADGVDVVARADHQDAAFFCHDVVAESLEDGGVAFWQADDVVLAVIEIGLGVEDHVAFPVGWDIVVEVLPCSDIRPPEVAFHDEDPVASLEDAQVDVEVGQGGEELGCHLRVGVLCLFHHARDLHLVFGNQSVEAVEHHLDVEEDETCVPQEIPFLHEHPCELLVGLFRERLHSVDAGRGCLGVVDLDVAVACLGACRLDACDEEALVLFDEAEACLYILLELLLVLDELVRGSDEDVGLRASPCDEYRSPCHGCKGASAERFLEDVLVVHLGQLLVDEGQVLEVGGDVDVLRVDEAGHAVVGLLQEGASGSQQIHELLGFRGSADGPQTASVSSGKNQTKVMFVHIL